MAIRNLSGETVDGIVGIGTTNLGTEARLHVGKSAATGGEGGQIILQQSADGSLAGHIDNFYSTNDYLRILKGGDTTSSALVSVFDLTNIRLGIGVYPEKALDVSGNARLQGGDRKLIFNNGSVETSLDQMAGAVGGLGTLGRFGVGTVAPNNNLQVVGNITFGTGATNEAVRNMMTGGTMVFQATDANHRIIIRGKQDVAGAITGNSNEMDFYEFGEMNFYTNVNTGTSSRTHALKLATNGNATFAGSVGIGLTPSVKLEIQDSTHTTMKIRSGNNDNIFFAQAIQSSDSRIGTETNTDFTIHTNGAERIRVDNLGNVIVNDTSSDLSSSGRGVVEINGTSQAILGLKVNGDVKTYLFQNGNNVELNNTASGSLTLKTAASTAVTIDSSQRVGIGTPSPTHKLQVLSTDNKSFLLDRNTGNNAATLDEFSAYYSLSIKNRASGSYLNFAGNGNGTTLQATDGAASATAKSIQLNPFGGNVGIGTGIDLPSENLTLQLDTQNQAFSGKNGTDYLWFLRNEAGAGARQSGRFQLMDTDVTTVNIESASNRNTYFNAGNVGIGTNSPSRTLHVASDSGVLIKGATGSANGKISFLPASGGRQYDLQNVGSDFRIFDASANVTRMYFDNDGNTGIGYTNPGQKLSVNGDGGFVSNSSSRVLYLTQQSAGNGNIIQFLDQSGNNVWELVGRNTNFYIYNNQNSVGYVFESNASNGYVAILKGGTDASYPLDVTGSIRSTADVIAYSDRRVKENIKTIDNALDKVTKLRGVSYNRKDIEDKSTKIGVIAQEVKDILPEVVEQDLDDKYSVAYGNMAGLFIEAIKELKAEIQELKKNK